VLVSTVELAWRARRGARLGLTGARRVGLDWRRVIGRKNRLVERWSRGKRQSLERQGIAVLRGRARFTGPHEVAVDGRRVTAERIVIATGSAPARPPIEGIEHAVTSAELFERTSLPERLVVIGGGYIGLELAFVFGRAGSRVTVLQSGPHVLPGADDELRAALVALADGAGITILTGARASRITRARTVHAAVGGTARRFAADVVLVATGRPANVADLGLDAAGVAVERGAVRVNERRQSPTAPHVYAAGDANGEHQHTPVAWYEGRLVAENALRGPGRAADFAVLPTATFTIPALAQVGLTEGEARRRGHRVGVGRAPFADSAAAGVSEETEGLVKLVYDEADGRLLGVHILGVGAEDLIHVGAVALRAGMTRHDLAAMHYVFPTMAGSVFDAASE
jgi:pyruvate/2-oxoglutarate dehydrogenase complex dihydrolipoamide dehydrogenase (E3) component